MDKNFQKFSDTDLNKVVKEINQTIKDIGNVKASFGEVIHEGDKVIIPVATVSAMGGGGAGSPSGDNKKFKKANTDSESKDENGGGVGIGFYVKSTPQGYIVIDEFGIRFEKTTDYTKFLFAGMLFLAMMFLKVNFSFKKNS